MTPGGSGQNPPFYGPQQVWASLDYDGCIAAVRAAMADFTADGKAQPLRSIVEIGPAKHFGLMPGMLAAPHGLGHIVRDLAAVSYVRSRARSDVR